MAVSVWFSKVKKMNHEALYIYKMWLNPVHTPLVVVVGSWLGLSSPLVDCVVQQCVGESCDVYVIPGDSWFPLQFLVKYSSEN